MNQKSVIMWMVLVCVSLDGRVKIVNKVKLKSVMNQRNVIRLMVLVCVSLDVKGKDCKQGKVKVCQEPETCDHVDGSCMCQLG